jgi:predicted transcriptional regulator
MRLPKISKQEWPVMEALWRWGALSIREITTGICGPDRRPAYTTVQTMVYRLEARGAVRRVEKIGNYHG